MTIAFAPPIEGFFVPLGVIVDAARHWKDVRARRAPVQPALFALLNRWDRGMLAPVLDSLFRLYEAGLGRPLTPGDGAMLSEDEYLLLGLVGGVKSRGECIECPAATGSALDCAICSARIMMALADDPHSHVEQEVARALALH